MRPVSHHATDHHRAGSRGWRGCSRSAEGRRRASNRYRVGRASISFPRGVARRRQARRQSLSFERPPTAGYIGKNWVSLNSAGLTPLSSHVRKPMQRSKNGHLWLEDLRPTKRDLASAPLKSPSLRTVSASTRIGAAMNGGTSTPISTMACRVFYSKPNVSPGGPVAPRITIDIAIADDRIFDKALDVGPELFDASKSGCDVRIGTNRFVGDLHRYDITATTEEISVDIELTGQVRAWRPKSGHLYFGAEGQEALGRTSFGAQRTSKRSL